MSPILSQVGPAPAGTARQLPPPNIVLIVTDDQRWDTLWAMPAVKKELVDHGITFSKAFVSNPLCCPSRASILTGNYSHTTGVYQNRLPYGGFQAFDPSSTVATWLDPLYTTALVGKYLNEFADAGSNGYVPPGWNQWTAFAENNGRYYDYQLETSGIPGQQDRVTQYGSSPGDYSTTVLSKRADAFVREAAGPFFLYLTPAAPHLPSTPAAEDAGALSDLAPWRPASYGEPKISDKPEWVREKAPLWGSETKLIDEHRLDEYRSLLSVDRMVGELIQTLKATGKLRNTMIIFTSDNGLLWGEHGLKGKEVPYDEAIRVPLVVRYDAMRLEPRKDNHLVVNIDLAPTIAHVAGLEPPFTDGRSFLRLLGHPKSSWRQAFLLEHLTNGSAGDPPSYCGLRTKDYAYISWETGERELYDLAKDPYELRNIVDDRAARPVVSVLRERLAILCSPPPPGTDLP